MSCECLLFLVLIFVPPFSLQHSCNLFLVMPPPLSAVISILVALEIFCEYHEIFLLRTRNNFFWVYILTQRIKSAWDLSCKPHRFDLRSSYRHLFHDMGMMKVELIDDRVRMTK